MRTPAYRVVAGARTAQACWTPRRRCAPAWSNRVVHTCTAYYIRHTCIDIYIRTLRTNVAYDYVVQRTYSAWSWYTSCIHARYIVTSASEKPSTFTHYQDNASYLTTGQWYTPSMAQSGVDGVMRQVIIDALSRTQYPVVIRPLQDEDLPKLTQTFFCNALRGIMPMSSLTLLSGEVVRFESV